MKSIAASLLKPEMVFSKPVYIDENNVLVPAGVPIRQKDLDDLKEWGVEYVQTEGVPGLSETADPPAENARAAPSAPPPAPAPAAVADNASAAAGKTHPALLLSEVLSNKAPFRMYMTFIERMNMLLLKISTKDTITSQTFNTIGMELLQAVRDQRERFISFIISGEVRGHEMAKSAVNIAILSTLMAQELHLPNHKTTNLIIGALLHDAGMLRLPRDILDKKGELSEEERQRMRNHPMLSHKIVTKELRYYDEVGDIVLQHHERWDGEGYPNRIAGERIELGARIVSITDAFEAMVSHKPYRTSMVGYQAMKNLLADNSRRFDPNLLKAFIQTLGIYPIGSMVRLNNGVIARIAEARPGAPLRPKIRILIDENKKIFKNDEGRIIDLLAEKNLYITKAVTAKELTEQHA